MVDSSWEWASYGTSGAALPRPARVRRRAAVVELVPNEDRVSPRFPAMFSFQMLGSTPQGEAYTAREFDDMGRAVGFAKVTVKPLPPTPQSSFCSSRHDYGGSALGHRPAEPAIQSAGNDSSLPKADVRRSL
jgi:hypothetical protein